MWMGGWVACSSTADASSLLARARTDYLSPPHTHTHTTTLQRAHYAQHGMFLLSGEGILKLGDNWWADRLNPLRPLYLAACSRLQRTAADHETPCVALQPAQALTHTPKPQTQNPAQVPRARGRRRVGGALRAAVVCGARRRACADGAVYGPLYRPAAHGLRLVTSAANRDGLNLKSADRGTASFRAPPGRRINSPGPRRSPTTSSGPRSTI